MAGRWFWCVPREQAANGPFRSALNTNGRFFKTRATFDNDQTPAGQVFQIVVLMPRTDLAAKQFQPGALLNKLPDGVVRSKQVEVVLQRPKQSTTSLEVIQVPKDGAIVGRNPEIRGRVAKSIRPVILVRSTEPDCNWWVQKPIECNARGQFQSTLIIGTNSTPSDTNFRIVAMLPRTSSQQALFANRVWLKELPGNVPQAKPVDVVFRRTRTAQADTSKKAVGFAKDGGKAAAQTVNQSEVVMREPADKVVITSPRQNSTVSRLQNVVGRISGDGIPVVLIRPLEGNSNWWVQATAQVSNEGHTFQSRVIFGSNATPDGSRFQVVILLASNSVEAEKYKVGMELRRLPADIPRSRPVDVTLSKSAIRR